MITYLWDGKSHSPDSPDQGYHTFVSPDGLHWTRHSEKRVCPCADVISGYYDRQRKLWVALAKITDVPAAHGRRVLLADHQPRLHPLERAAAGHVCRRPRRCRRWAASRKSARCSMFPTHPNWSGPNFTAPASIRPKAASGLSLDFHDQQSGPLRQSRRALRAATGGDARSRELGAAVPPALRRARHSPTSGTRASSSRQARRCASATKSGSTTAAPTIRTARRVSIVPTIRPAKPNTPARSAWPSGPWIASSRSMGRPQVAA